MSGFARGMRLSTELVAGVLVGAFLGWALDRLLATSPWGLIVLLMLGFVAEYAGGEATTRDHELEDVRWFTREELAEIRAGRVEGLHVPPPIAIARRLVDGWLD